MPKSLNDILKGVKKSTIEKLSTGDNPGVDYADKMKDGRDFVAQHTIEKHADRVGNDDTVYKGSTKKAEMKRHGHEPKPKDIKIYNKNQQTGQPENVKEETRFLESTGYSVKLPNGKLAKASNNKTWWHSSEEGAHKANKSSHGGEGKVVKVKLKSDQYAYNGHSVHEEVELEEAKSSPEVGSHHKVDEDGSIGHHVVTGVHDGVVYTQNVKTKEKFDYPLRHWHSSSSPIREEAEQIDELTGYQGRKGQKLLYKLHTRAYKRLDKALDANDIKTVRRNSQVMDNAYDRMKEEVEELDETSGMRASNYKKKAEQDLLARTIHDEPSETRNRKIVNRAAGMERAIKIIQKKRIAKKSEAQKEKLGEEVKLEEKNIVNKIKTVWKKVSDAHDKKMKENDDFRRKELGPELYKKYVKEEIEQIDEIKKPLANYIKKRSEDLKDFGDEESIRRYNKKGNTVGDQLGKDVKARSNKYIAKAKSKLGEEKDCNTNAQDNEPRYNGKDKSGKRKLLTDKKLQEMAASQNQAVAARIALKHKREGTMPPKGTASHSMMGMSEKQLHDYTKAEKGAPKKVEESISDQRSSRKTSSEEARKEIHKAILRKKEREEKMKEEAAATETPITFPVTNSREGFRI